MSISITRQPFNQKKRLLVVQILSILIIIALLFSQPGWLETSWLHEFVEFTGLGLILICIFGRLWSILYVGGRKNSDLVTIGPYSITRNPLYLFSTIGAVGIGLVFGSILVGILLGLFSYTVFVLTAQQEEAFLRDKFGAQYADYADNTPLFWPNIRGYRDTGGTTFSSAALKRTFIDALYFLAIFPLIEGIEYLQVAGYLPTLFLWPF